MVLAKMVDRGEQAIQNVRTNTEYRQVEAQVRQRLKENETETDIKPKLNDPRLEDLTTDGLPSSLISSPRIVTNVLHKTAKLGSTGSFLT